MSKDCEDNDGIGTATIILPKNEGVEIQEAKQTDVTSNGKEIKDQQQLEILNDNNDALPSLSDKEQNEVGCEILSEGNEATRNESNEATSFPTNKAQVIQQHKFYIHSSWLAVQSSYFRSLFYSGMKESNAKEVHVQISASEEKAHLMLLEAMYKIDVLDKVNVDELLNVLKLADKYDVQFVFKKCKYCLQAMVNSLEVCEKIMRFIKIDNTITEVEDLASTLQSFLVQEFSPLDNTWQTTSFEELCKPSVQYLLSSDELLAASENTVFHTLMYWIEQQGIENVLESEGMPSILSVVRFELISVDYLYNIVQHDSVAKKFPDFNHHYLKGISYHALSDDIKDNLLNQPVKRKVITQPFIPYTWVVPADELKTLAETEQELKSDEFWFCGYKMLLTIKNVKKSFNEFNATLCLQVTNLTQMSVVEISFYPASKFFSKNISHKTYKFKKNSQIEFSIHFQMKNRQSWPAFGSAFSYGSASGMRSGTSAETFTSSFNFGVVDTQFLSFDINMNLV